MSRWGSGATVICRWLIRRNILLPERNKCDGSKEGDETMSPTCESFIRAVLASNWNSAFLNLNGLNMYEMLRAIAALDVLDRNDLWTQHAGFAGTVNMPRIEYAWSVVKNRSLPPTAPGDLSQTGQVNDARNFLASPSPLQFTSDLTGTMPGANPAASRLSEPDFAAAAGQIGAEVSAIMAVAQVEAGGRAGFADGRPIIRYELHIFHGRTGGIYDRTHPHLSQPTLAAGQRYHGGGQPTEWSLMFGAMILRDPAGCRRTSEAWQSASWGMFQVMGRNFRTVGWSSIGDFVHDMFQSEGNQLRAFLGYVRANHLSASIASHNWAHFARGYNGVGYAVNQYDQRIAAAYTRIISDRQTRHAIP